jgi:hypothetical protein
MTSSIDKRYEELRGQAERERERLQLFGERTRGRSAVQAAHLAYKRRIVEELENNELRIARWQQEIDKENEAFFAKDRTDGDADALWYQSLTAYRRVFHLQTHGELLRAHNDWNPFQKAQALAATVELLEAARNMIYFARLRDLLPDVQRAINIARGLPTTPPAPVYTVAEFCKAHRLSRATFSKMQKQGKAPAMIYGGRNRLITFDAAQEWRKANERTSTDRSD